jgi:ATP-dependent Clp protease ATP-binding subunit ClpA
VVDKFIVELQTQLDKKSVCLEITNQARQWLATQGYDKSMGARPMARLIQEKLKKPLANEILFGSLISGGVVKVKVKADELSFDYETELTPA